MSGRLVAITLFRSLVLLLIERTFPYSISRFEGFECTVVFTVLFTVCRFFAWSVTGSPPLLVVARGLAVLVPLSLLLGRLCLPW